MDNLAYLWAFVTFATFGFVAGFGIGKKLHTKSVQSLKDEITGLQDHLDYTEKGLDEWRFYANNQPEYDKVKRDAAFLAEMEAKG